MSFSAIQNTYRPAPVRGAIVLRCKTADFCAPNQLRLSVKSFNMRLIIHDGISQACLSVIPSDRDIIQIPIGRRLL